VDVESSSVLSLARTLHTTDASSPPKHACPSWDGGDPCSSRSTACASIYPATQPPILCTVSPPITDKNSRGLTKAHWYIPQPSARHEYLLRSVSARPPLKLSPPLLVGRPVRCIIILEMNRSHILPQSVDFDEVQIHRELFVHGSLCSLLKSQKWGGRYYNYVRKDRAQQGQSLVLPYLSQVENASTKKLEPRSGHLSRSSKAHRSIRPTLVAPGPAQ